MKKQTLFLFLAVFILLFISASIFFACGDDDDDDDETTEDDDDSSADDDDATDDDNLDDDTTDDDDTDQQWFAAFTLKGTEYILYNLAGAAGFPNPASLPQGLNPSCKWADDTNEVQISVRVPKSVEAGQTYSTVQDIENGAYIQIEVGSDVHMLPDDGSFTIAITKWEGPGGIAEGTFSATLLKPPLQMVEVTEGSFRGPIETD